MGNPTTKITKCLWRRSNLSENDFRRAVRIELAKQKNKEKENILETRTKDATIFHKLIRNNRKKGHDAIMGLEVNGKTNVENDNIINGFQEQFSSLTTFNEKTHVKAAFDTVIHSHMLRRVFLAGNDDGHWGLIKDLHENAKSIDKLTKQSDKEV
ncbi:unnamed protein product [Mytilus coruscus]|uniref:Uncharacterized protein n=1 Tax=Mytilus coruscus TaxID=42192 RepID=A0A6J8CQZ5_MYTCO|nr:unnamed protein product [Mytilus coruscus]